VVFKAVSHSNENVVVERRTAYADAMKAQLNSGFEAVQVKASQFLHNIELEKPNGYSKLNESYNEIIRAFKSNN